MADWNPSLYLKFGAERTRPAAELVARIAQHPVTFAVDLGCGPGNSTALLHHAWPEATLVGVDSSPAMLDDAARALPTCRFVAADIRQYQPERPADLLYANASLQWLTDHETLFPHLVNQLADNGLLAVQMPDNWQEPSHTLMRQVAQEMEFRRADVIRCRVRRRITIFSPPAVARWISGEQHITTRWSRTRRLSTGCNPRGFAPTCNRSMPGSRRDSSNAIWRCCSNTIRYSVTERSCCCSHDCLSSRSANLASDDRDVRRDSHAMRYRRASASFLSL